MPGSPRRQAAGDVPIVEGFPATISGNVIFCPADNLNTDGIYPGKYTYADGFTAEEQAAVVMENYDPRFGGLVEEGDILVGGFNFGTGSSREQAATALKNRGLALVLAGSFSETYKRNALNNGFLVVEAPALVRDLKERFGAESLTRRTGLAARLDFRRALGLGERFVRSQPVGDLVNHCVVLIHVGLAVRLPCPVIGKAGKTADNGFVLVAFLLFQAQYFGQCLQ